VQCSGAMSWGGRGGCAAVGRGGSLRSWLVAEEFHGCWNAAYSSGLDAKDLGAHHVRKPTNRATDDRIGSHGTLLQNPLQRRGRLRVE
jgi:hypothetical protein